MTGLAKARVMANDNCSGRRAFQVPDIPCFVSLLRGACPLYSRGKRLDGRLDLPVELDSSTGNRWPFSLVQEPSDLYRPKQVSRRDQVLGLGGDLHTNTFLHGDLRSSGSASWFLASGH